MERGSHGFQQLASRPRVADPARDESVTLQGSFMQTLLIVREASAREASRPARGRWLRKRS
jgi:hypothetical protein